MPKKAKRPSVTTEEIYHDKLRMNIKIKVFEEPTPLSEVSVGDFVYIAGGGSGTVRKVHNDGSVQVYDKDSKRTSGHYAKQIYKP